MNGNNQQQHPIEGLMRNTMESIKTMIEVNTILGDPVETPDGHVILPVSRVAFGFAAGGSEFEGETKKQAGEAGDSQKSNITPEQFPFGGGTGAGVSLHPVAFLVVGGGKVRLLPVGDTNIYDRLLDLAPDILAKVETVFSRDGKDAKTQTAGQTRVPGDGLHP